jgi:hypothetical protein
MPPIYLAPKDDAAILISGFQKRKADDTSRNDNDIRPKKKSTTERQTTDAKIDKSASKAEARQISKSDFVGEHNLGVTRC